MAAPPVRGWETAVLRGVGAPTTPANLQALHAWLAAEGGSATNNPFNTTQPAPGASSYNSVGVRNFVSPQQGIQATIQTLQNGHYGNILQALKQGTSAVAVAQAIARSPWGTGSGALRVLGAGQPYNAAWGTPGKPTVGGKAGLGQSGLPPLGGKTSTGIDALTAFLLSKQFEPPQVDASGTLTNPAVHYEAQPPAPPIDALSLARQYLDSAKGAFTNPGFAQYLHGMNGVNLPGSTLGQSAAGAHTASPAAGDLAFFGSPPTHQAVMLDGSHFMHGTNGGSVLRVSSLAHPTYQSGLATVRSFP